MRTAAFLLVMSACTVGDEAPRCDEAAEALARCNGVDPATFLQACKAADVGEAGPLAEDILAQQCPTTSTARIGIAELAFVEVCAPLLASANVVDNYRNPSSAPLADDVKAKLRPFFGATVDTIRVHWNATLLDDWPALHIKNAFMDVGAQTFGSHIYAASAPAPLDTLAHEMTHTRQAQRFGGVVGFYREYCRGFYRSGFSYEKNPLEVEAYSEQARIVGLLR